MVGLESTKTDEVVTADIQTIDVNLLHAHDAGEYQRLLEACERDGFFYLQLNNYGTVLEDWQELLRVMREYFDQPLDVKMKDSRDSDTHGYEPCGTSSGSQVNSKDHYESLKTSWDEMMAFDQALPQIAKSHRELFHRYITATHDITQLILEALSAALGLKGLKDFRAFHRDGRPSLSTMSVFRYPKQDDIKEGVGHNKHTDLGTLTFLLTEQWGLQVLSPAARTWQFVKPTSNCAIVNVGDTLRFLSGFRLRSAVHQVVPLYGVQHEHRFSVAYFLRAENDVEYEDSQGRRFTSKKWHDTKFDVFRETHHKQEQDSYLTGGMERKNVLLFERRPGGHPIPS